MASSLSASTSVLGLSSKASRIADRRSLGAAAPLRPPHARTAPTVRASMADAGGQGDEGAPKFARRSLLLAGGMAPAASLALASASLASPAAVSAPHFMPQEIATVAGLPADQPVSDPHALLMRALPQDVSGTPLGSFDRQLAEVMRPVMIAQGNGRDSGLYRAVAEEGRAGRIVSEREIEQVRSGMRRATNTFQEVVASLPDDPRTKRARDALVDAIRDDVGALNKFASLPPADFREAIDEAADYQDSARTHVGLLASLQMPSEYLPLNVAVLPDEYNNLGPLPMLNGRALVEMTLKKSGGGRETVDIVLDGFSAPVSAGNFASLVREGFYDGMEVQRSDGFVVQTGQAAGKKAPTRTIPLEIKVEGDPAPTYGFTLDDLGRTREDPVLPFNAFGTLAVARNEMENDSGSSEIFFLLRESEITPTSSNVLDGRFATFGYATQNADVLKGVRVGDRIERMTIKHGADLLVSTA